MPSLGADPLRAGASVPPAASAGQPTLTVVTICRNALPLLRRTVDSVLAQECPGFEYWIVDGASTDGTREYLDGLSSPVIHAVSEPDRGIADAMNKGVRLSAGAWIAHLHAGDVYTPGALRLALERIARAGAAPAEGTREEDAADILCGYIVKEEEAGEVLYQCEPGRLRLDMTIHHPATFTRRSVFSELGGFAERYRNAMDYDFFLRAFVAGKRFRVIPEALARMAGEGQSEQSLWSTFRETHEIRRRALASGHERGYFHFLFLFVRGIVRRVMQRVGLGRLAAWYRRRFSMVRKT